MDTTVVAGANNDLSLPMATLLVIIGVLFSAMGVLTFRQDWNHDGPFDSTFKSVRWGMLPVRVFFAAGTVLILFGTLDDRQLINHTLASIVDASAALAAIAGIVLTITIRVFRWPARLMPPRFRKRRESAKTTQARSGGRDST